MSEINSRYSSDIWCVLGKKGASLKCVFCAVTFFYFIYIIKLEIIFCCQTDDAVVMYVDEKQLKFEMKEVHSQIHELANDLGGDVRYLHQEISELRETN